MPDKAFGKTVDWEACGVFMLSCALLILTFGAVFDLLLFKVLRQAFKAKPSPAGKGIYLLFGKKLRNGTIDADYKVRLERLLHLPYGTTLLLGGHTGGLLSEAEAGYKYLEQNGFPLSDLFLEEISRNTLENLKNARQMLHRWDKRPIIIVSNRYHLFRCSVLAKSLGLSHELCAAEERCQRDFSFFHKCVNEAFYLHWFYTGKMWALLTRNHRMLARIT